MRAPRGEESEFGPRIAECGAAGFISKSAFDPDRLAERGSRRTPPPEGRRSASRGPCRPRHV